VWDRIVVSDVAHRSATAGTGDAAPSVRRLPIVDAAAPAERLAMLRILVGTFALTYLLVRLPVFLQLTERESGFDGVGLATPLTGPVPDAVVVGAIALALVAGAAATLGWRHRVTGPVFALAVLALGSYRGSWGQLLHFENIFAMHLLIVGLAPAADAWSLDARRRAATATGARRDPVAYGWPIALAGLVVVVTYVITGVAKLRYGGLDWIFGDTLRNHVAYAAARLDLLGGTPSPFARWVVGLPAVWPAAAAFAVMVELAAPVAFLGGRIRTAWVVAAWALHVAILLLMLIAFPYPLFLVAFAPFYRIERLWTDRPAWLRSRRVGP
jgi:hypothetical protein